LTKRGKAMPPDGLVCAERWTRLVIAICLRASAPRHTNSGGNAVAEPYPAKSMGMRHGAGR
jgi:hypothetical protein